MINFNSRIPSAYQEVEYIQSTGTQYIDTGFNPNQDTRTVMTCEIISGSLCYVFGTWLEHPQSMYSVYWTNYWGVDYASSRTEYTEETSQKVTIDMNKNVITIGNTTKTVTKTTFTAPASLTLFALNNSSNANPGQPDYFATAKLYQCKMYDNGTLIRDFIPCYRKADNVAGMYDLVNNVFYTNAGTGSFTVGANVGYGSIEITIGSFIPKHFALRRRMMAITASAGFEWPGWANATWEDVYNLCKAKQKGKIDAWPSDVVLGAMKETTLSTAILGTSTFTMRIIGLDIDGSGVITFDSKYYTAQSILVTSLNIYQNNFYNYCNAKPYIKALSKGTAATNMNRNGAVTYADYYVWSLSEREINLDNYSGISVANSTLTKAECTYGVNQPYPYFTSNNTRKKTAADNSTGYGWGLRSVSKFGKETIVYVTYQGSSNYSNTSADYIRFSPCFAIG